MAPWDVPWFFLTSPGQGDGVVVSEMAWSLSGAGAWMGRTLAFRLTATALEGYFSPMALPSYPSMVRVALGLFLLASASLRLAGQDLVRINEFAAVNAGPFTDEDGTPAPTRWTWPAGT